MSGLSFLVLSFLSLVISVSCADTYSRSDFPPGFVFGAATSAYQVEGAANEDGRTPSIFDTFAHSGITHGANGDIACDQYHQYKEDVQLMADMGLEAYRFSISWTRLIPSMMNLRIVAHDNKTNIFLFVSVGYGYVLMHRLLDGRGSINPKGVRYYNNLINELTQKGIQPHVTLHHADMPQALEDEYGGWISRKTVKDFTAFADACFRLFGDRVKHWTTFNEANIFVISGYDDGFLQPQRCSSPFGFNCTRGNSSTEPYMAAHNILLSHASAARLYKNKYQNIQKGQIGLNLLAIWFVPFTNSSQDIAATQRAYDFYLGWFANPLVNGDYPESMKKNAGSRLPSFTALESKMVKGSFDFIGINFYFSTRVKDNPQILNTEPRDLNADIGAEMIYGYENNSKNSFYEVPIIPWGLQGVLEYFKNAYGNPPIFIHESGQPLPRNETLEDWPRVKLLQEYTGALLDSIRNGSNTKGYFTWSLLDVFELLDGYNSSYGLVYVDLDDPELKRYPKLSAHWYSHFLKGGRVSSDGFIELMKNFSAQSSSHFL